jgi:hypothetical protein
LAKGKAIAKRPARGRANGPSGVIVWLLWLIVIGLLAVIARYAYTAAQPDRSGYNLFSREGGLTPAKEYLSEEAPKSVTRDKRRSRANAYSSSDRAKLDELVDEALPAKR